MIEQINLSDIDIKKLILVKETYVIHNGQDHSRWVFKYNTSHLIKNCSELYFKIWNPSYIRRDNIIKAIDSGFYDKNTTPALKAILYHNGLCRGYVMDKCYQDYKLNLDERFYALIKEMSTKTKFFNAQFSPCHVLKYKDSFSLIDLEGVFLISDLTEIYKQMNFFDYEEYERFIVGEYDKLIKNSKRKQYSDNMRNKHYFRKINPLLRLCQSAFKQIVNSRRVVHGKNINMIEY